MGLPPVPGAVQLTFADPLPAVAETPVGAAGAVGCELVTDTSSRYMEVWSAGTLPSSCTLNQSTTFWPAYGVRLKLTWVQACEFVLPLKTLASVWPEVLRIWASSQSYTQPLPEQRSSVVAGLYQKLRDVVPAAGTVIVCARVLSPSGSVPESVPSRAAPVPE